MSLISIIIPCYNYGWLLAETLESVVRQSYRAWECIVIDDGSGDNTKQVAEEFASRDSRIKYAYQANAGMSAARNNGLRQAKGDYVQFLDADDLLTPHKLEVQIAKLQQSPEVDILYGDMRYFRHGQPDVLARDFDMGDSDWMVPMHGSGIPIIESLIKNNKLPINAALTSRKLIEQVGGFDESLRSMEDWEFWLRCALAGATFQYDATPEAWVLVRLHPSSTSNNRRRMSTSERRMREQIVAKLENIGAHNAIKINAEAIQMLTTVDAVYHTREGHLLTGLREFMQLASSTGKYKYYLSSALYWLRHRAAKAVTKSAAD
ncbi:MAG TPA: glycosyltransferase [Hymenobacter sp.]|uniref:glycosyltransferase family 2 protein n=1 Tax=Hymenobacter sp. TaxID=1898978 RepID=UPI002D7FCB91|nr:glycosyltransferase [Hymenobacter sp.]HET9503948.1 glycosyltransferase [Hymenobacter sp.]